MTIADMVVYEADQYFERNQDAIKTNDASRGTHLVAEFIQKFNSSMCHNKIRNFCEIGCNYGYNLFYLSKQLGLNCSGIEPSPKAVNYGIKKSSDFGEPITRGGVRILQGLSNNLPFDNEEFDAVMVGFSLYVTPREMIVDSIREVDRVLKHGGFLFLTDFDTPIWYKRVNKHNNSMPVYKEDYAQRFLHMGYTLAEKISYSHLEDCFSPDIQERVSTQFLYKERYENLYINA